MFKTLERLGEGYAPCRSVFAEEEQNACVSLPPHIFAGAFLPLPPRSGAPASGEASPSHVPARGHISSSTLSVSFVTEPFRSKAHD